VTGFIAAAALAGLVGSPHCAGMCGGFALACGGSGRQAIPWHLGRLATYAALGAAAGGFGNVIPGPGWVGAVISTALIVWFSAALAGWAPEPRVAVPGLTRLGSSLLARPGLTARFAFGLANGLLPCGLVYAALAIPVAAADPVTGALAMLAFGAGTIPLLSALILGGRRLTAGNMRTRRVVALAVLVLGLTSVGLRISGSHGGEGHGTAPPSAHQGTSQPGS
jgi:sulfite exporter TauE/SafE